ncbi:MAG: hypothetical protein FJZ04_03760, partial [Candidatus Moranbacteria bacterium]|nr:hypothetical protein [Candidatus Moranbacteria bacterium]
MAQPKQIKAYKKVRIKSAKELVIKNFGPDVFALLKKRYAMYRGKDDIQATVYKFLVDNKYSYREISALTGKTHEAIRRAINKKILSTKYPVPSLEVIQKQEKEERLKLERPRGIVPEVGQLAPEMIAVAPVMSVEEEEEPISEAQTLDPKSQHPIKPQISKPEVVQEVVQKESILDKMLEEARDSSANAVASVEEEVKVPIKVELMPDQVLSTKGLSTEYQTSVGVPSASGEEKKTSNLKIGKKTKLQSSDSKFQIPDSKFRYNFFPALAMGAAVLLLVLGVGFFGILPRFEKLNSLIAGLEDKLRSEMAQIGNLGQKGEKSWWEA